MTPTGADRPATPSPFATPTRRRVVTGIVVAGLLLLLRANARLMLARVGAPAPPLLVVGAVHTFWLVAAPLALAAMGFALATPRRRASRVAIALAAVLAVLLLEPVWTHVVVRQFVGTVSLGEMYFARTDANALVLALLFGTELAAAQTLRVRRRLGEAARLQHALADAHLHALTIHLQPHFLFNTLQLVAETARTDPRRAAAVAHDLRRLVAEAAAHTARRVVTARAELDFLAAYLSIQQTRFEDRLVVDVRLAPAARDAELPHMLLQPLVENAIQHGIARRAAGGRLTVVVDVVPNESGPRLVAIVANDGPALDRAPHRTGRGLANTRARLTALYGGDHRFTLAPRDGGGTTARVEIPMHPPHRAGGEAAPAAIDTVPVPATHRAVLATIAVAWVAVWLLQPLVLLLIQGGERAVVAAGAAAIVHTRLREAPVWIAALVAADTLERRHPPRWSQARLLVVHAMTALTLAVARELFDLGLARAGDPASVVQATLTIYGLRVVGIYAASVALLRANVLAHWAAAHSTTVRELQQELRRRQQDATRAMVHQPVVLACLDALEASCRVSPARVESCVRSLSTALRLLLEALDDERHALGRDLAILDAVCAVFDVPPARRRLVADDGAALVPVAPGTLAAALVALDATPTHTVAMTTEWHGRTLAVRIDVGPRSTELHLPADGPARSATVAPVLIPAT